MKTVVFCFALFNFFQVPDLLLWVTFLTGRRAGSNCLVAANAVEVIGAFEPGSVYMVTGRCFQLVEIFLAETVYGVTLPTGDTGLLTAGTMAAAAGRIGRYIAGRLVMTFDAGGVADMQLMIKGYRNVAEAVEENLIGSFFLIHGGGA